MQFQKIMLCSHKVQYALKTVARRAIAHHATIVQQCTPGIKTEIKIFHFIGVNICSWKSIHKKSGPTLLHSTFVAFSGFLSVVNTLFDGSPFQCAILVAKLHQTKDIK